MDQERLVYMVNQIARNFAAQGETEAIMQTAKHIKDFWDPHMRAALLKVETTKLEPLAQKAVAQLIISKEQWHSE